MKNKKLIRMITVMLLLMVFAVSAGVTAMAADVPVYLLAYGESGNSSVYTASYVSDGSQNYLVTSAAVDSLESQGQHASLEGINIKGETTYNGTNGPLAYYTCAALDNVTPMQLGNEFTSDVSFSTVELDQSKQRVQNEYTMSIDGNWVAGDNCIYTTQMNAPNNWYHGAPVLNSSGMMVGVVAGTDDGKFAIIPLVDPSNVVSGSSGTVVALSNGNGNTGTGTTNGTNNNTWLILILVGGGAAAIGFSMKNKSGGSGGSEDNTYGMDNTSGLDADMKLEPELSMGVMPDAPAVPAPVIAPAVWQIRAMGGAMDGKVYLINGTLTLGRSGRCDVVFPQSSAGVSGEHCRLTVVDGRAVLRDLQSSYGTFLSKRIKLEPHVDYHLQLGDEFTIAEGGQTFRLERAGEMAGKSGPSVRSVAGNRTFHADLQGRIAFGRSERCQVKFRTEDNGISGSHCVLYRDDKGLVLMDTGSSNGTFFEGGQRLKANVPYRVKKGTSFFLTSPKYTFIITED